MLPSLVRHLPVSRESEDIFTSSLGLIFTDAAQDYHGDAGSSVIYSSRFRDLKLRLADPEQKSERGLFAHYVWNASILMGEVIGRDRLYAKLKRDHLDECSGDSVSRHESFEAFDWNVKGESVLELGAGTGLVSLVSFLAGASPVTITDYPSPNILTAIQDNVDINLSPGHQISVCGHAWGTKSLVSLSSLQSSPAACPASNLKIHNHAYTRVIATDTLWLSAQHSNLLKSIDFFLAYLSPSSLIEEGSFEKGRPEPQAWIAAGFHTGRAKVVSFFDEVESFESESEDRGGFVVDERWEVDVNGVVREWKEDRVEDAGERGKWSVVAVLKRRQRRLEAWDSRSW